MHGLTRVRQFTITEAHIILRPDQAEEELIVHRVISVEGDIIVTKGDANTVCDRPFRSDALKGRVIAWIPCVGAIANILENVVPLLTALILVTVVVRRIRNKEI